MNNEEAPGRTCPKCGARFLEGRLYWATGKPGDPKDLAGLVCQPFGDASCINPMKEEKGGDTWDARLRFLNAMASEFDHSQFD